MSVDIRGAVAMVTGASRGIGRACAVELAGQGCPVALLGRDATKLEETATRCRDQGVAALPVQADATDEAALRRAVDRCVDELGGLAILVNNAGIMRRGAADEMSPEDFWEVFEVNVRGLVTLTRAALPHVEQSRRGAVINVSSIAGHRTFPGGGAYCGSKHAVQGYTGSLFEDVREHGVKVCAVSPGYVNTELLSGRRLDPAKMIQPADIAETVAFVARFPETGCPTEIVVRPQRSPYL